MRILWSIHLYPPKHNCGGEYMAHNLNKFLISKGHSVRVLLHTASKYGIKHPYDFEGVTVFPLVKNYMDLFRNADVIFTHLEFTERTIQWAGMAGKPVVQFIHNDSKYQCIMNAPQAKVVYNSNWIKEKLEYPNEGFVMKPPVDFRHYDINKDTSENEYITLINLDQNKGGHILRQIAEAMPERKFLGVIGSYSASHDPLIEGQQTRQPGNVTVIENTTDILSVYAKTRVLLMPSLYESWGRTATEAMCSGIPVICTKTPGLMENCGNAAIYINDRDNISEWVKAIKSLDKGYNKISIKSKERSREHDPIQNLEAFENWMKQL